MFRILTFLVVAVNAYALQNPEVPFNNNVTLGINYTFPTLRFERVLTPHLSIGAKCSIVNYPMPGDSIMGVSGALTVDYYTGRNMSGTWAEIAPGVYHFGMGEYPSIMALLGWRWQWEPNLNFGIAGGVSYVWAGGALASGLLPGLDVDFGLMY